LFADIYTGSEEYSRTILICFYTIM